MSISLYANASSGTYWNTSDITGLTPGQSSDGYTSSANLATDANTNNKKKVCTVTYMAANAPTWNWSADYTTCTPYIIKWTRAGDYVNDNTHNVYEPVFTGVTFSDEMHPYDNGASDDLRVRFIGTYTSTTFTDEDQSILFLGVQNTLYYPQPKDDKNPTIGAFRAYFKIGEDGAQSSTRQLTAFNIGFGDNEAQGITTTDLTDYTDDAGAWYSLDGRKLEGKPSKAGLYIHGGKKVVIRR